MKNILFICALPDEKNALMEVFGTEFEQIEISQKLNLHVEYFKRSKLNIYISESGMGNVNAGTKLALTLEKLAIDQIILIGVGGALTTGLEIGDMILSDQVIQHDYYSSLDDGNFLMKPGDLILSSSDAKDYSAIYTSTAGVLNFHQISQKEVNVKEGLVASGCEFVGTTARKQAIHQNTKALLVDMEACAVAQVASKYQIPFFVAKTVSDKLNPDGSIEADFQKFLTTAAKNAAMVAKDVIEILER